MSSWNTYGVSVTDETHQADVIEALENCGLRTWESGQNVKATDFASDGRAEINTVKQALQPHCGDEVDGFVHVYASDTGGTASGTVWKATTRGWERGFSRSSGEGNRRNWGGLSFGGVRVAGGKY